MSGPVFIPDPDSDALRERIAHGLWNHDWSSHPTHSARGVTTYGEERADYLDAADAVLAVLAEVGVPAVTEGHTVWDAAWRAAGRRRRFVTSWEAAP